MLTTLPVVETLHQVYTASLCEQLDLDPGEAAGVVWALLVRTEREAAEAGTLHLPSHGGDQILAHERRGILPPAVHAELIRLRAAGVRDADLRAWYNLHDLERRMLLAVHDLVEQSVYAALRHAGHCPAEAGRLIRRRFPRYTADPLDPRPTGVDRPLPVELMLRVTDWLEQWMARDPAGFDRALDRSSSCNALVRRELLGQGLEAKPCVLVVEDDPDTRKAVLQMLEHLGYATAEAEDGREAVARARAVHPEAVLMDLMMPEVDGYTAARQLKSDPTLAHIPIAAFSAFDSVENQRAAREAGMGLFLAKPVSPARLEQVLRIMIAA